MEACPLRTMKKALFSWRHTTKWEAALVEVALLVRASDEKNTNEIPSLQSRSGFLNYCGTVAPFRVEFFHRCDYEEEHELKCHFYDDHFQDASVQDASVKETRLL